MFELRGAVQFTVEKLGCSQASVYRYIKTPKPRRKKKTPPSDEGGGKIDILTEGEKDVRCGKRRFLSLRLVSLDSSLVRGGL